MDRTTMIMREPQQNTYYPFYEKMDNKESVKFRTEIQLVVMIRNLKPSQNAFLKTLKLYELCCINLNERNDYMALIKSLIEILIDEFLYSVQNAQKKIEMAFSKQSAYYQEFYPSSLEGFAHKSHADLGLAMQRMAILTRKYEHAIGVEIKILFNNYYQHFLYLTEKEKGIKLQPFTSQAFISFLLKKILQWRIRKNEALINNANIER